MLTRHTCSPQARARVAHEMMELSLGLASPGAAGAPAAAAAGAVGAEAADPASAADSKAADQKSTLQPPPQTALSAGAAFAALEKALEDAGEAVEAGDFEGGEFE